jgi:hypothetical protein
MWAEFREFAIHLMDKLGCCDVSACLEICTQTLEEKCKAKVHMHVWLRHSKKVVVSDVADLIFRASRPNYAGVIGGIVRDTKSASFQGALYVSSLKKGSVFTYSTREPFTGYLVQPSWLMNFLQSGKISFDVCKAGVIRTCQNVAKYLKDLEVLEQSYRQADIDEEVKRVAAILSRKRRPFLSLEPVARWKAQYQEDLFRFRFLVLEGPSQFGKTQFVRSIASEDAILEVNCSGGVAIDLRSFERHRHKVILFDEIEVPQVLKQRKLFQAGPTPVQLGQSQTGMYSYSVFLYRTMLVVCTNNWSTSLGQASLMDQDWIRANQVFINVQAKLFE